MIYFMQPLNGGPVKIGHTTDLDARRETLEFHYGTPLVVLATRDGGRAEERAMHERFAHLRLGKTEQFRPGPDLMAFLGHPTSPTADTIGPLPILGRETLAVFKGSPAYGEWLRKVVSQDRAGVTTVIDQALAMWAEKRGYDPPPPRLGSPSDD